MGICSLDNPLRIPYIAQRSAVPSLIYLLGPYLGAVGIYRVTNFAADSSTSVKVKLPLVQYGVAFQMPRWRLVPGIRR